MGEVDLKIDELLAQGEVPNQQSQINSLQITQGAFNKMMTYAKVVSRVAGGGMECYGYLLKKKNALDDLIVDILFAEDQQAVSTYVRVTEEGVYSASQTIEPLGYEIIGWWHSHGSMSPFHSGTDERNFLNVLHSIAPRTLYKNEEGNFRIDRENKTIVMGEYTLSGFDVDDFKKINPQVIKKAERDPLAFSIVVNQYGQYYREKITKTFDSLNRRFRVNSPTQPVVEVLSVEDDVEFNVSDIEKDARRKIVFGIGRNGGGYGNRFGSGGRKYSSNEFDDDFSDDSDEETGWFGFLKRKKDPYKTITQKFDRASQKYHDCKGKHRKGVKKFKKGNPIVPFQALKIIADAGNLQEVAGEDFEEQSDKVYEYLSGFDSKKLNSENAYLSFGELNALLCVQFMVDFNSVVQKSEKTKTELQDELVEQYQQKANDLQTRFDVVEEGIKAMTNYSMELFADYGCEKGHSYRKLVFNFLSRCAGGDLAEAGVNPGSLESVLNKLETPVDANGKLILREDKYNIITKLTNYFVQDLTSCIQQVLSENEQGLYRFLEQFPAVFYQTPEIADEFIEQKLIPLFDSKFVGSTDENLRIEQQKKYQDSSYVVTPVCEETLSSEIEPNSSSAASPFKSLLRKYFQNNSGAGNSDVGSSAKLVGGGT
ncbi:hypothetical protein HN587_00705 [Candidatus Woesearchaeota archaeon]|nr:hypothetical protein [Candidatus Woesearchaeota archaeon]